MKKELEERLVRYVRIDTQADMESPTCPSTPGQLELAKMLVAELEEIGMSEVTMDDNGYVMATLPATLGMESVPTIGFLAHLDTATDMTGKDVKPKIVKNYDGKTIDLNEELGIELNPDEFPNLVNYIGHDLVTTDGTTLLGADNKAGIAEIMTAMEYLIANPEIAHGKIRVAFTPDEEIGRGPHKFDVDAFGAKYAYTIDGGPIGQLQYESFNAASAFVTISGNNVHPGTAKDVMVHAGKIAMELHAMFPAEAAPELTDGYDGFYHLIEMNATAEAAKMFYIVRDFDMSEFKTKKELLESNVKTLNEKYGAGTIELKLEDSYYNMAEVINEHPVVIEVAKAAMEKLVIKPKMDPIRGGTDGSQLSLMGLPTPNIFVGGENFHGKFEFASLDDMEKATMTIVEIAKLYGEIRKIY